MSTSTNTNAARPDAPVGNSARREVGAPQPSPKILSHEMRAYRQASTEKFLDHQVENAIAFFQRKNLRAWHIIAIGKKLQEHGREMQARERE